MNVDKYYAEHGIIYGLDGGVRNGSWTYTVVAFSKISEAKEWVSKTNGIFSKRELAPYNKARRLVGEDAVSSAVLMMQ